MTRQRRRSKHRTRQRLLMIGVAVALGGVAVWCARQVGRLYHGLLRTRTCKRV